MSATPPVDDQYRLLHDLRRLVTLHRDFGILDYPRTTGLEHFLQASSAPIPAQEESKTREPIRKESAPKPQQAHPTHQLPPIQTLSEIKTELGDCTRCALNQSRDRLLFGAGSSSASLVIVGDFPTRDDEIADNPFGGETGELLTRMLKAIGLDRNTVYLTTTVKCRTADNGPPEPEQIATCLPFLIRQIEAVAPKVICTMGPIATQALLKDKIPLVRLRGRFHQYRGIELMPTFHPSFLIKNPDMKKAAWVDLQLIQAKLGESTTRPRTN